jgi:hypothetical protein
MYSVTQVRLQPRGTQLISKNPGFYSSICITARSVTACQFKQSSYCHQPRALCVQVGPDYFRPAFRLREVCYSTTPSDAEFIHRRSWLNQIWVWSAGGMILAGGCRSTRSQTNLWQCHFVHNKSPWNEMGLNPGLHAERPATNRLSRSMASSCCYVRVSKCGRLSRARAQAKQCTTALYSRGPAQTEYLTSKRTKAHCSLCIKPSRQQSVRSSKNGPVRGTGTGSLKHIYDRMLASTVLSTNLRHLYHELHSVTHRQFDTHVLTWRIA